MGGFGTKLGTQLIADAVIGAAQLEIALRNQVLFGGRLGTNLVELGFVTLDDLAHQLEEQTGFPVASASELEHAPSDLLAQLGADFAVGRGVIPLGVFAGSTTYAVAFVDPFDGATVDDTAQLLNGPVVPYIVPELRGLYFLERHFGLPRHARYVRAGRGSRPARPGERRREQPTAGIVMPPTVTLEPRRRKKTSLPMPLTDGECLPVAQTVAALATAPNRDAIGRALCAFGRGRFSAFVVFSVRDANAIGWCGVAPYASGDTIALLAIPLGGVSALQEAHDAERTFVGFPPSNPHPIESDLWRTLCRGADPVEVIVAPIVIGQRVVTLLYGQGPSDGTISDSARNDMTEVAAALSNAYNRLCAAVTP